MVKSWLKRGKHLNPHVCSCMHLQIDQPLSIFHCPSSLSLIMYFKKKGTATKGPKISPASWLPTVAVPHPSAAPQRYGAPKGQRHPSAPRVLSCAKFDGLDW